MQKTMIRRVISSAKENPGVDYPFKQQTLQSYVPHFLNKCIKAVIYFINYNATAFYTNTCTCTAPT